MYIYIYIYIYTYIYICMFVCMYICMYIYNEDTIAPGVGINFRIYTQGSTYKCKVKVILIRTRNSYSYYKKK